MKRFVFYGLLLSFIAWPATAVDSVVLKGLFGEKAAVLFVDGRQTVLKTGEMKRGVKLLQISNQQALIEYDGQQYTVTMSKKIGSSYKEPAVNTVVIPRAKGGHYWAQGEINGFGVRFVVDTGATAVSLNASMAKRFGVDYENGRPVKVSTANGTAEGRNVVLKKVSVGSITKYNITATIMLDDSLPVILLGNSFLSSVNMSTENGILTLKDRF